MLCSIFRLCSCIIRFVLGAVPLPSLMSLFVSHLCAGGRELASQCRNVSNTVADILNPIAVSFTEILNVSIYSSCFWKKQRKHNFSNAFDIIFSKVNFNTISIQARSDICIEYKWPFVHCIVKYTICALLAGCLLMVWVKSLHNLVIKNIGKGMYVQHL